MTLFHDPDGYTGGFDVAEVLHLAADFESNDPTAGDGLVTDDEIPWVLVGLCIICAVTACGLGVFVVQVARHWVGLAQFAFVWTVLTLLALGIDRVLAPVWSRAQGWFR